MLYRMLAEQRLQDLLLEGLRGRVGPVERRGVYHVGQTHAIPRMFLAGRTQAERASVGERTALLVTRGTEKLLVTERRRS